MLEIWLSMTKKLVVSTFWFVRRRPDKPQDIHISFTEHGLWLKLVDKDGDIRCDKHLTWDMLEGEIRR
jgi:hypothetical protein